jgi:hypothetical protein
MVVMWKGSICQCKTGHFCLRSQECLRELFCTVDHSTPRKTYWSPLIYSYIYIYICVCVCVCVCVRVCWMDNRNMYDAYNGDIQQLIQGKKAILFILVKLNRIIIHFLLIWRNPNGMIGLTTICFHFICVRRTLINEHLNRLKPDYGHEWKCALLARDFNLRS